MRFSRVVAVFALATVSACASIRGSQGEDETNVTLNVTGNKAKALVTSPAASKASSPIYLISIRRSSPMRSKDRFRKP